MRTGGGWVVRRAWPCSRRSLNLKFTANFAARSLVQLRGLPKLRSLQSNRVSVTESPDLLTQSVTRVCRLGILYWSTTRSLRALHILLSSSISYQLARVSLRLSNTVNAFRKVTPYSSCGSRLNARYDHVHITTVSSYFSHEVFAVSPLHHLPIRFSLLVCALSYVSCGLSLKQLQGPANCEQHHLAVCQWRPVGNRVSSSSTPGLIYVTLTDFT